MEMVIEAPREIHFSSDVLRGYIKYVESGGSVEEFGREMTLDPERPELETPKIIIFSALENRIAQRGLWRHLGVIYRGIKRRTKDANSPAIPRVTMDTLHFTDELIDDTNQSTEILNRAYDRDEELWLPEVAYQDADVSQVLVQTMLRVPKECPVDWAEQLNLARRAQAFRRRVLRDDLASLAIDLPKNRAHPSLIKLAKAVIDYQEE